MSLVKIVGFFSGIHVVGRSIVIFNERKRGALIRRDFVPCDLVSMHIVCESGWVQFSYMHRILYIKL